MGNCNFTKDRSDISPSMFYIAISSDTLKFVCAIGKGGFGKVWRAEHRRNKISFAIKEMDKSRIVLRRSVHSVMNERNILALLHHSFIVNMQSAFQDRKALYLVLDLKPGGDLRYHLTYRMTFTETETKFFISCILLGLQYVHENNIIHRDIKPENIVLDSNGYAHITDFGIARVWHLENKNDTSGTPGYMSPEVICRQNHCKESDFFALGVIMFEFMTGKRPYLGKTRKDIRDDILTKQVQLKSSTLPSKWSACAGDLTNRLLQRKPQSRIGYGGIKEIMQHPWLADVDWEGIMQRLVKAPFVPKIGDNYDQKQVRSGWPIEHEQVDLDLITVQKLFTGYEYEAPREGCSTAISTELHTGRFN